MGGSNPLSPHPHPARKLMLTESLGTRLVLASLTEKLRVWVQTAKGVHCTEMFGN